MVLDLQVQGVFSLRKIVMSIKPIQRYTIKFPNTHWFQYIGTVPLLKMGNKDVEINRTCLLNDSENISSGIVIPLDIVYNKYM